MDEEDMSDIDYHLEWRKVQLRSHLTPPLKSNSASATLGNDIYMFGGQGAGQFQEVWKFCGKQLSWQEVVCTSVEIGDVPSARDGHTMVKISDTKLVIYAGQGGLFDSGKCERATEHGKVKYLSMRKLYDDMYELDVSTLQWTSKPRRKVRPLGRRGHTMTYLKPSLCRKDDDGRGLGKLLLFGGSCLDTSTGFEKVSNDVWLFSLSSDQWAEVECGGVRPRAVYGHCAVLMDEAYVVIGGSYAPPKKEGFLSKAKALAPKKKVVQTFSSAVSDGGESSNIISVLNVTTFQWSSLNIDCVFMGLDMYPPFLNITGHSAMKNPLNVREILIFGGREVETDNSHFAEYAEVENGDDVSFVTANLFTLNVDECTLKHVEVGNSPGDSASVPEARLNHMCQRNIEGHIVLNYNREEANKSKKQKSGRRIFDITAKKKEIVGQPVLLVYGGLKANSPGFCDCSVFQLYFVPSLHRRKKEEAEIKFTALEENSASVTFKDDMSKLSLDNYSDYDERSLSPEKSMRSLFGSCGSGSSFDLQGGSSSSLRALKLKPDCSTQLLSPKRGLDGHYFDLKSALSYSKSTFVPSSSKVKPAELDPPPPATLDPLLHKGSVAQDEGNIDDESASTLASVSAVSSKAGGTGTVLSSDRMRFMSAREIMKTRTQEIAPKTKGMTVHNARSVYQKLYPLLPGLSTPLKKKSRNLK